MALISLSTAIATLGLIQNSTAVVIGAMLVAPLMTPLLGAGLALVQANLPLLREASKAISLGFLSALTIGFVLGYGVPDVQLTAELQARGGPNLLDLGIAFLSGIAAAHCVARPNLSAALPGVAIAAALVPPVATTGVSVAIGEYANARGAALLFATNVVAIILGASFCMYAGGVRRSKEIDSAVLAAKRITMALVLAILMLCIPLGSLLLSKVPVPKQKRVVMSEAGVQELNNFVHTRFGGKVLGVAIGPKAKNGKRAVVLEIESSRELSSDEYREILEMTKPHLPEDLRTEGIFRVRTALVFNALFEEVTKGLSTKLSTDPTPKSDGVSNR